MGRLDQGVRLDGRGRRGVIGGGRAEILAAGRNGADKTTPVECRQELRRAAQVSCGCWALTPLAEQDGWLQLPARTVTFAVSAVHADRAQLVFMPTGSGAAWSARVVDQDRMAADGLRLAWNLSALSRAAHRRTARPGGITRQEIGSVHREEHLGRTRAAPKALAAGGALVPGRGSWRRRAERLYAEISAPRTLGMAVHKEVARHAESCQA